MPGDDLGGVVREAEAACCTAAADRAALRSGENWLADEFDVTVLFLQSMHNGGGGVPAQEACCSAGVSWKSSTEENVRQ